MSKKEIKIEKQILSKEQVIVPKNEIEIKALIKGQRRVIIEQRKQIRWLIELLKNAPKSFGVWIIQKIFKKEVGK